MTVIAVCNQKGGSGKITVAINLADAFAADGMAVLLHDMDPKGTSLDWGSIRPALSLSPWPDCEPSHSQTSFRGSRDGSVPATTLGQYPAKRIRGHRHRLPGEIR